MLVFIAFISIVLLSLVIQWLSKQWIKATLVPVALFSGLLLFTNLFQGNKILAFTFGLPMVFCAALLGSYLYETKINPQRNDTEDKTAALEQENEQETND